MKIFDKLFHHGKKKKRKHNLKKTSLRKKNFVPEDNFLLAENQPRKYKPRKYKVSKVFVQINAIKISYF